jgi:catechol 2,3-dioxygenase-like lactoylglutathione lyase family enzyme
MGLPDAAARAPDAATVMPAQQVPPTAAACAPRKAEGPAGVFFHHIHFNTTDPNADLAFYEKYFGAMSVDFCTKQAGAPATRATRTERGYFLYSKVATPPDPSLNAYLEHIGWCHPDPAGELQRQVMLGAPLWPSNPERGQCETAAAGQQPCNNYWYYLQAPSGARVEIALGPGPATMGFGHIHVMMGEDLTWYKTITGGRYADTAIDMVNITNVLEDESYLAGEKVADTRGKPIDHIGFSTSKLEAERDRIAAAGIEIAEDISFKPEYGFRSFFIKSAKGIWVEMVEDTAFAP